MERKVPGMTSLLNNRSAFTLIELLAVIAIIGILAAMFGSAAFSARQTAYRAQASTEARELSSACQSYWIASGAWEGGSRWPGESGTVKKDSALYKALTGDNPAKIVFMNFDEIRLDADDNEFLDPWGHPYEVAFDPVVPTTRVKKFSSSVSFPMRNRYQYYGKMFTNEE